MAAYNETMAKVAQEEGVGFIGSVLDESYGLSESIDNGHSSFAGNQPFARGLANYFNQPLSLKNPNAMEQTRQP